MLNIILEKCFSVKFSFCPSENLKIPGEKYQVGIKKIKNAELQQIRLNEKFNELNISEI